MRFVYMDEAGISADETVVVVTGICIDGDRQWKLAEKKLSDLVEKYIAIGQRDAFVFHAKEIFHGNKSFPRDKWALPKRMEILKELISIPRTLGLPTFFGFIRKDPSLQAPPNKSAVIYQAMAFAQCAVAAESYMRDRGRIGEIAILIAEDNDQVRKAIKTTHHTLSSADARDSMAGSAREFLPIERIVDTIHFAGKHQSPLLQIADACAFVFARHMAGRNHVKELYDTMTMANPLPGGAGGFTVLYPDSRNIESGRSWFASTLVRTSDIQPEGEMHGEKASTK